MDIGARQKTRQWLVKDYGRGKRLLTVEAMMLENHQSQLQVEEGDGMTNGRLGKPLPPNWIFGPRDMQIKLISTAYTYSGRAAQGFRQDIHIKATRNHISLP